MEAADGIHLESALGIYLEPAQESLGPAARISPRSPFRIRPQSLPRTRPGYLGVQLREFPQGVREESAPAPLRPQNPDRSRQGSPSESTPRSISNTRHGDLGDQLRATPCLHLESAPRGLPRISPGSPSGIRPLLSPRRESKTSVRRPSRIRRGIRLESARGVR